MRLVSLFFILASFVIKVGNQGDFDSLQGNIVSALLSGKKDIRVEFSKGTYEYRQYHINLESLNHPAANITFEGNGATVVSRSEVFKDSAPCPDPSFNSPYVSGAGGPLSFYGPIRHMDEAVRIVDAGTKLCRAKCKGLRNVPEKRCKGVYISLCESYRYEIFKVRYIKRGYVYFVADNLGEIAPGFYNVNHNIYFSGWKVYPCYRLFNLPGESRNYVSDGILHLSDGGSCVRYTSNSFFQVINSKLGKISFRNLTFTGSSSDPDMYNKSLMYFRNAACKGGVSISGCRFSQIRSHVLDADFTDDIAVVNCRFEDLYNNGLYTYGGCRRFKVTGCEFNRCGADWSNSVCVRCQGDDYLVSGNTFTDFGYCAVSVGVWFGLKVEGPSRGVVEGNVLSYSKGYSLPLCDSGALYANTYNDRAVFRNNLIKNCTGLYCNHGIYLDDGANNVTVEGNVVLGMGKGESYSIFARRCDDVDKDPTANIHVSNTGNVIGGNYVDGNILYASRRNDSSSRQSGNYIVAAAGSSRKSEYEGFARTASDKEISMEEAAVKLRPLFGNAL